VKLREGTAWLDLQRRTGRAEQEGVPVVGPEADAIVAAGFRWFYNDVFWLAPHLKLHDEGATLELLEDGRLLVRYASGGLTPGDTYAFRVDAEGLPVEMQLWVDVLPIGGLRSTWRQWEGVSGSARLSKERVLGGLPIRILDFACAGTVAEIEPGLDPLAGMRSTVQ
jgi:hypothetical protein